MSGTDNNKTDKDEECDECLELAKKIGTLCNYLPGDASKCKDIIDKARSGDIGPDEAINALKEYYGEDADDAIDEWARKTLEELGFL